jgi:hypothetical protein
MFGIERFAGEIGETSLSGCLNEAVHALPDFENAVEILFWGVHMGTYNVADLIDRPAEFANRIIVEHAAVAFIG